MNGKHSGLVIKSTGSQYWVLDDAGKKFECALKGKFRLQGIRSTNPIAVGDRVIFEDEDIPGTGTVTEIMDRKNYIIRKSTNLSKESHILAANIDLAFLVVTLRFPEIKPAFIDRFLAAAEAYRIPVCLLIHKMDIYTDDEKKEIEKLKQLYEQIGYEVLLTSIPLNLNLDEVKSRMKGKVTLFSGNSGVGKSTLVNTLQPGYHLRTAEVSSATLSGKHTTTFAEMIPLDEGGFIVDTPGVRGFGLVHIEREEVYHFFPEIFRIAARCRYHNCLHTNEPFCAVKEAVRTGEISGSRYMSYLGILSGDEKYRS